MVDTPTLATYDEIASEYYDPARHPTCANFREASSRIIEDWIRRVPEWWSLCEVGAGRSLVAELLADDARANRVVVASDASPSMLRYSAQWAGSFLKLIVCRAERLPFPNDSLDVVVSSLGDPYNSEEFWSETYRVLRRRGFVLFTTPAHAWANAFRSQTSEHPMAASFRLSDGRTVEVPSWILPVDQQLVVIEGSGFVCRDVVHLPRSSLKKEMTSPKLQVGDDAMAIVTGFLAEKTPRTPR